MKNSDISALLEAQEGVIEFLPGARLRRWHTTRAGWEDMLAVEFDAPTGWGRVGFHYHEIESREPGAIRREVAEQVRVFLAKLADEKASEIVNQ